MLVAHWMKAAAIFIYVAATAFVLSQCNRLLGPPRLATAIPEPRVEDKETVPPSPILQRAEERARERKEHVKVLARQHAEHLRLEAHLVDMLQSDIPAALADFAGAAVRFRNKLSDLKHLKTAEQWEREAPVKEALKRARDLTGEWYALDREAQKGRDGPTLHAPADIDALTQRIAAFKRGGEDIVEFAGALPALYPRVPKALMVSAIDVIARVALPQNAFDPCRDPAACPKPAPKPFAAEVPPPGPMPTNLKLPSGPVYCVDRQTLAPHRSVALHEEPAPDSFVISRIPAGTCGLTGTGTRGFHEAGFAREPWLEVIDRDGNRGWVMTRYLRLRR